jgi:hypothetical protein
MIVPELTVRKGKVVWDLNGRAGQRLENVPIRPEEVGQVATCRIERFLWARRGP